MLPESSWRCSRRPSSVCRPIPSGGVSRCLCLSILKTLLCAPTLLGDRALCRAFHLLLEHLLALVQIRRVSQAVTDSTRAASFARLTAFSLSPPPLSQAAPAAQAPLWRHVCAAQPPAVPFVHAFPSLRVCADTRAVRSQSACARCTL